MSKKINIKNNEGKRLHTNKIKAFEIKPFGIKSFKIKPSDIMGSIINISKMNVLNLYIRKTAVCILLFVVLVTQSACQVLNDSTMSANNTEANEVSNDLFKAHSSDVYLEPIDLQGYQIDEQAELSNGVIRICNDESNDQMRFGFINLLEGQMVQPKYVNRLIFSEGVAFVIDENGERYYINTQGEKVIEKVSGESIGFGDLFKAGYAKVVRVDQNDTILNQCIIDTAGNVVFSAEEHKENLMNLGNGFFERVEVTDVNHKSVFDVTSKVLSEGASSLIYPTMSGNGFYTTDYERYGVMINGEKYPINLRVISPIYEDDAVVLSESGDVWLLDFKSLEATLSQVSTTDKHEMDQLIKTKWGRVNLTASLGEIDTDHLNSITDTNLALNFIDQKSIIINMDGTIIAQTPYDYIGEFTGGIAVCKIGDQYGLVNVLGSEILEVKYDYVSETDQGNALVLEGGRWLWFH